jgi:hypothetical protein
VQTFGDYRFHGLVIIVFCVLVYVGVNYLGYIELAAARRTLSRKMILSVVKEDVYLHELTQAISRVTTVPEYWDVVLTVCKDMNFTTVQMQMQGVHFEEVLEDKGANTSWNLSLSLGPRGNLRITRTAGHEAPDYMMRALVHLQKLIEEKELSEASKAVGAEGSAPVSLSGAA